MPKTIEKKLIEAFKEKESFSRADLFHFYRNFEPDLKEGTFGWRIYDLKTRNIIKSVKRGVYVITYKPKFKPEIDLEIIKLAKSISNHFEGINHAIWSTAWLNELSRHQSSRPITIIEIEKEFTESLYYRLKDDFRADVFLSPDEKMITFYVSESQNAIVINKLITRSPVSPRKEKKVRFKTPQLEKILVDLFSEPTLFSFYQGSELINIYEQALKNYTVNFTRLFSYAARREKEQDIKQFLITHLYHLVKEIIDD